MYVRADSEAAQMLARAAGPVLVAVRRAPGADTPLMFAGFIVSKASALDPLRLTGAAIHVPVSAR